MEKIAESSYLIVVNHSLDILNLFNVIKSLSSITQNSFIFCRLREYGVNLDFLISKQIKIINIIVVTCLLKVSNATLHKVGFGNQ